MRFIRLPDREYLRECFRYDRATGSLVWRFRPASHFPGDEFQEAWNTKNAGLEAGWVKIFKQEKYIAVSIGGVTYRADRVIWKMVTGDDPARICHKNGSFTDNSWTNLFIARPPQPYRYPPGQRPKRASDAVRQITAGVYQCGTRYRARFAGKHLGYFADPNEAMAAYAAAVQAWARRVNQMAPP